MMQIATTKVPVFSMSTDWYDIKHFLKDKGLPFSYEEKLRITRPFFQGHPHLFTQTFIDWNRLNSRGEDKWQREVSLEISDYMLSGEYKRSSFKKSTASGHGIGKSTKMYFLTHWGLSCFPYFSGRITAPKEEQLKTTSLKEQKKWLQFSLNRDEFEQTEMKMFRKARPISAMQGVTWSKSNPHGIAGTHEEGGCVMILFDEASEIDDPVWEVAYGSMTTLPSFWFAFGNPTKNSGFFYLTQHKMRDEWRACRVDSRETIYGSRNKAIHDEMIANFGEDSDIVKVRIKGQFPSESDRQFISTLKIEESILKFITSEDTEKNLHDTSPIIIGVDVARYGDDSTVILIRKGQDIVHVKQYQKQDTVKTTGYVVEAINNFNPQRVFIDDGGIGGAVVDNLRSMGGKVASLVSAINFGSASDEAKIYANKRAEMWGYMRDWIYERGKLPKLPTVDWLAELQSTEYFITVGKNGGKIQLESKDDLKKRGGKSPDVADALALTFARPVPNSDVMIKVQSSNSMVYNSKWANRFK